MIALEDRQRMAQDIDVAHEAGARLRQACGDGRPQAVRPMPCHALTQAEREQVLQVAKEPRFADVPPARIVPMLADEGVYIASESSFARILRAHGQNAHRGRARAPRPMRPPTTHVACAPREVWCWDMTYLPAMVVGRWFHLYLILDLFSRKIVGWEVHATDDANHAARHELYTQARESNPARWSRNTRDWSAPGPVTLNPERDSVVAEQINGRDKQSLAA
jgi:putative transposase